MTKIGVSAELEFDGKTTVHHAAVAKFRNAVVERGLSWITHCSPGVIFHFFQLPSAILS